MKSIFKAAAFVASFAVIGSVVTTASAETQWERNHPRRDQVNDRLASQNRRINNELKEGEINKQQAGQLHGRIMRSGRRSARCQNSIMGTSREPIKRPAGERRQPPNRPVM